MYHRLCISLTLLAFFAMPVRGETATPLSPAAAQWWADIAALADDANEGRLTGSAGYQRAADYVLRRFQEEGLAPAGADGFLQPVRFQQQTVDQAASTILLIAPDGSKDALRSGEDVIISAAGGPRPATLNAPLVFIGYGLHLPEQRHDDFAGQDLKGKIVVVLSGGPTDITGPVKSYARFSRLEQLSKRGAKGVITLTTQSQIEIPWARQKLIAHQPGMYLADAKLRDIAKDFFIASVDPQQAERLFAGSGHSFAELAALADGSKPLPHFALPSRLETTIASEHKEIVSPNLIAELKGSDPTLTKEYVAVSAHLDHLGIGDPIKGDSIYNGAMDDASGVATVLDIAHILKSGPRPRRSVLFVIFTAEEKGLLGSRYFALRPTVPKNAIIADFNFDMALPLWTLKSVYAPGQDESSLGADASAVAKLEGLTMIPDPMPDRNVFTRTDQFSFVREGIPALAFKFGFAKGTPEFQVEHDWRANRYHAPSDDLSQPVEKEEAVKLDTFVAALTKRVADAPTRPQWLPASIFAPHTAQRAPQQ